MQKTTLNTIYLKPQFFSKWLVGEMYEKKIRQADIGKWLKISQQAVGKKLREYNFTYLEMLIIFQELGTDKETQIKVML